MGLGWPSKQSQNNYSDNCFPTDSKQVAAEEQELDRRGLSAWEKFEVFERRLAVDADRDVLRFRAKRMAEYVANTMPQPNVNGISYSQTQLLRHLPQYPAPGYLYLTAGYCGQALRIVLEKIGDSLPDEAEILVTMLRSVAGAWDCAQAVFNTAKHRWRRNPDVIIQIMNASRDRSRRKFDDSTVERIVDLAAIAPDPEFLYIKDNTGAYSIYRGKDTQIERILLGCACDAADDVREKAFKALSWYLDRHPIDTGLFALTVEELLECQYGLWGSDICQRNPLPRTGRLDDLAELLAEGLSRGDRAVLFAFQPDRVTKPISHSVIPALIRHGDDNDDAIRRGALRALAAYSPQSAVEIPALRALCQRRLADDDSECVGHAVTIFLYGAAGKIGVTPKKEDIQLLINAAYRFGTTWVGNQAMTALAALVLRDVDLMTENQLVDVEPLLARDKSSPTLSTTTRHQIDCAYTTVCRLSGLRELALLTTVPDGEVRAGIEQLIAKSQKYRVVLGHVGLVLGQIYVALLEAQDRIAKLQKTTRQLAEVQRDLEAELRRLHDEIECAADSRLFRKYAEIIVSNLVRSGCPTLSLPLDVLTFAV